MAARIRVFVLFSWSYLSYLSWFELLLHVDTYWSQGWLDIKQIEYFHMFLNILRLLCTSDFLKS